MYRRHLILGCISIAAGIALNVAIAMSCVIAAQSRPRPFEQHNSIDVRHWPPQYRLPDDKRPIRGWGRRLDAPGYFEQSFVQPGRDSPLGYLYNIAIHVIEAGWPAKALQRSEFRYMREDDDWDLDEMGDLYRSFFLRRTVPSADSEHFVLPLRPLLPGFAANSVLYSAVVFLLLYVPWQVRRLVRRYRGLCPRCAYPIGQSDRCSECGQPIAPGGRRWPRTAT